MHHMLFAGKRRNQHDQRRLRQMKIRDQTVHAFEAVPGINEDGSITFARFHRSVLRSDSLNGTAAGGADTDYTMAGAVCLIDEVRILLQDPIRLRMHLVIEDILLFHRPERT